MDSSEVTSELALADAALPADSVLVGGLGLGYTAARLLDHGVNRIRVVELADQLVAAARAGVTEQLARVSSAPAVELVVGDIADEITGSWDAILLDVDNGPTFLIHDQNARLYRDDFLAHCIAALNPAGRLVIWCEAASPELAAALEQVGGQVSQLPVLVRRGERHFEYVLYRAVRPGTAGVEPADPGAAVPGHLGG